MAEQRIGQDLDAARDRLQAQAQGQPRPMFLTVPEVAELARCEHKAVRQAIHDGLLPAFDPNRRLLVREADAIAWVESRPVNTAPRRSTPRPRAKRSGPAGSVQALREIERELTR